MDHTIYFNGIDSEGGGYARPPRKPEDLRFLLENFEPPALPRRLAFGLDPVDLSTVGWGVLWPQGATEDRRQALEPLLEYRRQQAGNRYFELDVSADESPFQFLERQGTGLGPIDPTRVPYHLLIAASPEEVSFTFQSELGATHSVGRLDAGDLDGMTAYAQRLVDFETAESASPRHAAFFGVEHRDDPLTRLSVEYLVGGLEKKIAWANQAWRVSTYMRHAADKHTLKRLLHDTEQRPALLFTASHGLQCRPGTRQKAYQGALICSDFPGPKAWRGRLPDEYLFAAHDVPSDLDLSGLVLCSFACYSAGVPRFDSYSESSPKILAERPFVAPLANALLRQGALGVIGHVDVTFEQSFLGSGSNPQLSTFESLISAILAGCPLGHAMDYMASRYAQLAVRIASTVRRAQRWEPDRSPLPAFQTWAAFEDAKNFLLLGDPAARLHL